MENQKEVKKVLACNVKSLVNSNLLFDGVYDTICNQYSPETLFTIFSSLIGKQEETNPNLKAAKTAINNYKMQVPEIAENVKTIKKEIRESLKHIKKYIKDNTISTSDTKEELEVECVLSDSDEELPKLVEEKKEKLFKTVNKQVKLEEELQERVNDLTNQYLDEMNIFNSESKKDNADSDQLIVKITDNSLKDSKDSYFLASHVIKMYLQSSKSETAKSIEEFEGLLQKLRVVSQSNKKEYQILKEKTEARLEAEHRLKNIKPTTKGVGWVRF